MTPLKVPPTQTRILLTFQFKLIRLKTGVPPDVVMGFDRKSVEKVLKSTSDVHFVPLRTRTVREVKTFIVTRNLHAAKSAGNWRSINSLCHIVLGQPITAFFSIVQFL